MEALVLLDREYIHIFSQDFIGLLRLFWEFLTRWQLTCGALDVLLLNFIQGILYFREKVK